MGAAPAAALAPEQWARAYGERLLAALGCPRPLSLPPALPSHRWAQSGLMALTGAANGPPQMCPIPIAAAADGVLAALASFAPHGLLPGVAGANLLSERAALAGTARAGAISAGGSCRLLPVADGAIALNLARADDWALLPAWLECDVPAEWLAVAQAIQARGVAELVERGRLLGLAVAADALPTAPAAGWCVVAAPATGPRAPAPTRPPRVVDLSSLWAGPLCSHLLQQLGAEVIKVESPQRPDGARQGPPAFFNLLHAGQRSVAVDTRTPEGVAQLRALLLSADIVIEASRPRALRQWGLHAEALLAAKPALTWVSITGYGRAPEHELAIAYGDDAAVAAGLSTWQAAGQGQGQGQGARVFCGDAIADPLTGLHAALAAWATYQAGGGRLLSLALSEVVREVMAFAPPPSLAAAAARNAEWLAEVQAAGIEPTLPPARHPQGAAPALGADTQRVFATLTTPC